MATTVLKNLLILIGADTTGAAKGIQDVNARLGTLGRSSQGASLSMSKLQGGFLNLARQATNANPAIATIANTLGTFRLGSPLMIGVLGGIALVGTLWKKNTDVLKGFEEQAKSSLDALVKLGQEAKNQQVATFRVNRVQAEIAKGDLVQQQREMLRSRGVTDASALNPRERGAFNTLTGQIGALDRAISRATEGIAELEKKARDAAEKLVTIAERVRSLAVPERVDLAAMVENNQGIQDRLSARARFMSRLPKTTKTRISSSTGAPAGEGFGVGDAFSAFKGGIADTFKATFSPAGLTAIGANLASGLIEKFSGMVLGGINKLLAGTDRLAQAIERNSRALGASTEAVTDRLKASGLAGSADEALRALQGTADRFALGELARLPTRGGDAMRQTLLEELSKAGIDLNALKGIAGAIGIQIPDQELLTIELLNQFIDQLSKAVGGLGDLTDATNRAVAALNNVPSGFKVARARFNASDVDLAHSAARGGAYAVQPAYMKAG